MPQMIISRHSEERVPITKQEIAFCSAQDSPLGEFDRDGYLKNRIDWSLNFNYNLSLVQVTSALRLKSFAYKVET